MIEVLIVEEEARYRISSETVNWMAESGL